MLMKKVKKTIKTGHDGYQAPIVTANASSEFYHSWVELSLYG